MYIVYCIMNIVYCIMYNVCVCIPGTLRIPDISAFHSGKYQCLATNSIGTAESTADIAVKGNILSELYSSDCNFSYCFSQPFYSFIISATHGGYSEWSDWSNCSVSCGDGTQYRMRLCNNPSPSTYGLPCNGPSREEQNCTTETCTGKS